MMQFQLKVGGHEMSFEGEDSVFDATIKPMAERLFTLGETQPAQTVAAMASQPNEGAQPNFAGLQMTTKAIAAKLGASSGSDLVVAAAAALSLAKGHETFTRHQINEEMKSATGFYKQTQTSNLSSYLDGLQKKGTLIEVSKGTYTLSAGERKVLEQKLAG